MPSLRQLRYLVVLSETRNFTRAAETCFVTQSTLSAGLKELETTLGVQLVERDRQSVRMTPVGDAVADRARGLLAGVEDLVQAASAGAEPMTGTVRLGAIPTIAPFLLPSLLPVVRERYPQLRLALREDLTANLLVRLGRGELDFALIALPFDTGDLLVRPLFDDELWLVAPKGDPQLAPKRLTISQRMTERLLILEEGHCLRDHTLEACGRAQVASAEGIEATSLLTLVEMVESGLGLALVPEIVIQGGLLASSQLVARPLASPAPKRIVALVARRSTARSAEF
ncbi:MAG TPA: LysR substrate-binding domain-containing protein, partial [Burkholderiaceae bacterium]|nr:LysR substrate-binding domain-containing protein [Burkholderiaceae bacterium]